MELPEVSTEAAPFPPVMSIPQMPRHLKVEASALAKIDVAGNVSEENAPYRQLLKIVLAAIEVKGAGFAQPGTTPKPQP